MDILQGKQLQDYLFHIRDLESVRYEQEQYINYLKNLAERMRHPALHAKTVFKKKETFFESVVGGAFVTAFICAIVGAIACPLFSLQKIESLFDVIACIIMGGIGLGIVGIGVGIPVGIVYGIYGLFKAKQQRSIVNTNNENILIKNKEIIDSAEKRIALINKEISKAVSLHNETLKVLNAYYSKNIVYKKYHSLVPITMFCEYLVSGRCNTLAGHEGAYNIYENEVRQNIIISKLDNIIDQLESIKQNQYMIADMIQKNNWELHQLSRGVEQQVNTLQNIEANSEITAYYSKISAVNTSYLSWLAYIHQ